MLQFVCGGGRRKNQCAFCPEHLRHIALVSARSFHACSCFFFIFFMCNTEQLLEFMHQLPAFANMTMSVRRDLCSVMMFEVVEQAGTVILHDKQEV